MRRSLALAFLISSVVGQISVTHAQHATMSDKQLMQKLKGAAPKSILDNATILNMGSDGKMKVIKEGTNGWTCMDPGGEPMCADKAGMEWMEAWQEGSRSTEVGIHLHAARRQRVEQYRPIRHQKDTGQQLGEDRASCHDRRSRGQEHDARLSQRRQSQPQRALCHVAGNAL